MSIQARKGELTVRWREDGTHRSRTLSETELIALLKQNERPTTPTIYDLACEWWEAVGAEKKPNTQKLYRWLLESFVMDLRDVQVGELTPGMVEDWNRCLDTGAVARGKAQTLLGQIVKRAVKARIITQNPVELADRPVIPPKEPITPPSVLDVEKLRAKASPRDSMAIGLMAYAGLAPVDAFSAAWSGWSGIVLSGLRQKSSQPYHVPLGRVVPTVATELNDWERQTDPEKPIVGPQAVASWRKHVWYDKLGATFHPYAMRHLAVSSWLRDPSVSRQEAADWAGHSLKMQERYSHIVGQGEQSFEDAIGAARRML